MIGVLKKAAEEQKFSVLFATGDRNYQEISAKLKDEGVAVSDEIKVVPYINNMATVMAAADLVVSRAGAITVSEIAALGKASILIPSPNVVRNHQEQNAREFEKNDAAVVIVENELTDAVLYDKIDELTGDKIKLSNMGKNVKKLAKLDALEEIYKLIKKSDTQKL